MRADVRDALLVGAVLGLAVGIIAGAWLVRL